MEKAGEEDREDLVDLIELIKDALQTEDSEALKKAMDELTDLVYYLES